MQVSCFICYHGYRLINHSANMWKCLSVAVSELSRGPSPFCRSSPFNLIHVESNFIKECCLSKLFA